VNEGGKDLVASTFASPRMTFQGEAQMSKSTAVAHLGLILSLFAAVLLFQSQGSAQQVYGSVYGTVSDASGAVLQNAKITITDVSKNIKFETTTNEDGNYTQSRLIPGTYSIEVEATGFRKAIMRDVVVNVDQAARLDFNLELGNVTEQVEISASAPLLQSDRADVATTLTGKQLVDLPSFGRNFQAFELLLPGTNKLGWQHASSENPQGSVQIMVNGQHFNGTGFQLDGTDNQDPILGIIVINPDIDSITETKIASQNYDAEFGYAGAGIINTSTKSGTNNLHGSAFEYLFNNSPGFQDFARNPFNSAENVQVPPVKYNQFGGSIGGRVIRDKLFFFGDAQLTRRRTGSSVLTSVPTLKARTGDLSEYIETSGGNQRNLIYDPLTGDSATGLGRQRFANNVIPPGRLSQQALNILKFLPPPNAVDRGGSPFRNNYAASGSEAFDSNQWDTRADYFINEKSSLFGRYSDAAFNKFAPGAFGILAGGPALDNINFAGTSDVHNRSLALGYTRSITPTLVTDFRFGYMRYKVNVLPNGLGTSPAKDAGIPGLNLDNFFTSGLPAFFINGDGGTNLGYSLGTNQCNCPLDQKEQEYQFVNNTTKIAGNHSFKLGADIRYALNLRVPSDSHRAGELSFGNGYTGVVDANGSTQQGLGLATFLLGQTTGFSRYVSPNVNASERQKRFFWYAQDTWRITSKLQLNYGLRWEMVFPEKVNAKGNGGQLDLRTGEIAVFGVGGVSDHGIQEMNWHNFAPRLGITYQLTPKTVVRAGYGWSYELGTFGSIFGHNVTQNLPVLAVQQLNAPNNFSGVFSLATGPTQPTFPTPNSNGRFPLPNGVSGKARPMTLIMPRVMAHNFTVQHQFANDLSVSVGYVGNQGRHVFNGDGPNFNVNEAAFVPGIASSDLRKPFFSKFGWTQGIDFYCNCATNHYNSLQVQVDKRYSHGYTLTGSYTYQKAINDDGSSFTFLYNRPLGRGEMDNITHHQITAAQTWEIPFGHGRMFAHDLNRGFDAILGGWNITGITTIYSGRPFTPNIGDFPAGAVRPNAGPSGRPDQGSADPFDGAKKNRDQWYVGGLGKAFLVPANNTFGNYPRNSLRGPKFVNQDVSLAKRFAITEKSRFELRAEAFNAFNHTNLGDPDSNVTSGNAGRINGLQGQMRRLQFAARIDF
jgi:hypothetical protein